MVFLQSSARRAFALPTLLVALLPACANGPRTTGRAAARQGTPVVLVSIDTLRADRLPAYGYAGVATPAIDRLQRDAIVFENAYSHSPLTLPSHSSLLSGLLPPEHGVRNNIGYKLDAKHETLASLLAARGYATGAAVSAYVLRRATGIDHGFDSYDEVVTAAGAKAIGEVQRDGRQTVARALAWLRGASSRPFFLFVHLYEPHTPWTPPADELARYGATYEGEIAAADAALGQLLEGLRELGRYDEALVVLVSDHGEGLDDHGEPEHGILLYREALHVPLVVKLPRAERASSRSKAVAGLRDVVPTVAAVLGIAAPAAAHGRNLLDDATGTTAAVYSETYYPRIHLGWSELRSLVDGRYHLIDGPRPELYDVVRDPAERVDILAEKPQAASAMRTALAASASDFKPPAPATKEERERLMSLGYLAGGTSLARLGLDAAQPARPHRELREGPRGVRARRAGEGRRGGRCLRPGARGEPGLRGRAHRARRRARAARPLPGLRPGLHARDREGARARGLALADARARRARDGRSREGDGFGAARRSPPSRPLRTSCSRRSPWPAASWTRRSARPRSSPETGAPRRARPWCWPR